jgi:uncharacterized protein (DUF362 family)
MGAGGAAAALAGHWITGPLASRWQSEVFIGTATRYEDDLSGVILSGLRELGVGAAEIAGRGILLKPNLVEARSAAGHVNTDPRIIRAAVESFRRLGAARVLVAEGDGHRRDSALVLDETGLGEALREDRVQFVDLNYDALYTVPNHRRHGRLERLTFPETLRQVDWIVSMPKLKTHHWAGVTLSMKNLFGVMPGIVYGWPKNVLHWAGIHETILDIHEALRPHLAIVDGIVGMEGDGPIMGTPKPAGVLVMGRSLPAVDATCSRVMGIDPNRIPYLDAVSGGPWPLHEMRIAQRGEPIGAVRTDFQLVEGIDAHQGIRLL